MARRGTGTSFLLLFLVMCFIFTNAANEGDDNKEINLLLSFKASVNDPLRILSNWNVSVYFCNWYGVSCVNSSHVLQLELVGKSISGHLPSSVFLLPFIQTINLPNNQFFGVLPNETFSCVSLHHLNLTNNNFTGPIPRGAIPALETLDLSNNMLSGEIPSDIHLFSGLQVIDIGGNVLKGEIPRIITNLRKLRFFTLASNQLVGEIPREIGQMTSLEWIYFGYNNLSGEIPKELGYLTSLHHLDLVYNYFSGEIPSSLGNLTNLHYLFLYQNRLTGPIPLSIFSLRNLISLDLSDNYLSGEISEHVGQLENLEILHLFSNKFTGKIQKALASLRCLRILQLWSNQLTGEIPESLGKENNLTILDLSSNDLTGRIPEGLCSSGHLFKLILFSNSLKGELPKNLSYCKSLQRVRLENNRFSGELSLELTKMPLVYYLDISNNHFSGKVDKEKWQMPSLQMLSLAKNRFVGHLQEFSGGDKLENLNLSENYFSGSIPASYGDLLELMQLKLSQNHLTGSIPEQLCSCKKLVSIDFRRNLLTGLIPVCFSKMSVLSQLDLSENQLSGEIPSNLGAVESLVQINISYNQFSGGLPPTGAFLAINASAVAGNELCGGDAISGLQPCRTTKKSISWFFITSLLLVVLLFVLTILISICIRRRSKWKLKRVDSDEYGVWDLKFFNAKASKSITIDDMLSSLKEENIICKEPNGILYKGKSSINQTDFVIKKLTDIRAVNPNFWTEMEEQGRVEHPNLIKLLGICRSEKDGILIYEFIHDGNNLSDTVGGLSWERRRKIAIGIAKALRFLHCRCSPSLLVGDLSMENVIIDGEDEPRLRLGFPGSVLTGCDSKHFLSCAAPETTERKEISVQTNVYALGVLLIEILTGKHPADAELGVHKSDIVDWARYCYSDCHVNAWIDSALKGQLSSYEKEMVDTMNLALHCTSEDPATTPCSNDIVRTLEAVTRSRSYFPVLSLGFFYN